MKLRDEMTSTVTPEQMVLDGYRMTSQTIRIVAFELRERRIENPYIQCGRITNPTERQILIFNAVGFLRPFGSKRPEVERQIRPSGATGGRAANPTEQISNPTERRDRRSSGKSDRAVEAVLFKFFGNLCFLCGELTTIMGSAKGGKTFLTSMVMACCQMQQVKAMRRGIGMKASTAANGWPSRYSPTGSYPPSIHALPPSP